MKIAVPVLIAALALSLTGCGKSSTPATESSDDAVPVAPAPPASTNKADYAVFPDTDGIVKTPDPPHEPEML